MHDFDWRYWAALAGTAIWVGLKDDKNLPRLERLAKIAASGLLAMGVSKDLSPFIWGSETVTGVLVMALGLIILDGVAALIADRKTLQRMVFAKLGIKLESEDK